MIIKTLNVQRVISLLVLGALLFTPVSLQAFETDQYNLPPKPLADIGDEVSEHVHEKLLKAVAKINDEIIRRQNCLSDRPGRPAASCESHQTELQKLEYLRSEDGVTREVFEQLGDGIVPFTHMGTWMDTHHFHGQPARYRTSLLKSIFILPHVGLTVSPTVRLYGAEFGTDKIAHLFQQGYTYYKTYRSALAEGAAVEAATQRAVRWGQKSERTFYGTLVAGVYSNGDLAANYAGLKFYESLTHPVRIGDETRPALLLLRGGLWKFNEEANLSRLLLQPFISDHFNEALNPSIFTENFGLRWYVRRSVRGRSCAQWFKRYPDLSRSALEERSRVLRLWYDEDYGFKDSEHFVTIANSCFDDSRR